MEADVEGGLFLWLEVILLVMRTVSSTALCVMGHHTVQPLQKTAYACPQHPGRVPSPPALVQRMMKCGDAHGESLELLFLAEHSRQCVDQILLGMTGVEVHLPFLCSRTPHVAV